jgi:DNA-binding protein H-NS
MARGVKGTGTPRQGKSLDTRISEIDAKIETLQNQLSDAKAKRKMLLQEKEGADLTAIQKVIQKSGLTAQELQALIDNR